MLHSCQNIDCVHNGARKANKDGLCKGMQKHPIMKKPDLSEFPVSVRAFMQDKGVLVCDTYRKKEQ